MGLGTPRDVYLENDRWTTIPLFTLPYEEGIKDLTREIGLIYHSPVFVL